MTTNGPGPNGSAILAKMRDNFDQNRESIDNSTFEHFCRQGFDEVNTTEKSPMDVFRLFDLDKDGKLDSADEKNRFKHWLKEMTSRKSAFIVVDVQNDFINGTLSIHNGPAHQDPASIIAPINHLLHSIPFDLILYTFDWHPPNHISFLENINSRSISPSAKVNGGWKMGDQVPFVIDNRTTNQRVWPRHCVQKTWGSELDPRLDVIGDKTRVWKVYKGQQADVDSYSAFFDNDKKGDNGLDGELKKRGITDVYVSGLAYDVCVGWTVEDALRLGYRAAIVDDCSAGLDTDAMENVRKTVRDRNGVVIKSHQIEELVQGKRVPWNWAYGAAVRMFQK